MELNVWQAEAIAAAMSKHDDPTDDTLKAAYADIENVDVEGERLLVVKWENGGGKVLWHDGADVTDEYPQLLDPKT